jgi:hypothetical protein
MNTTYYGYGKEAKTYIRWVEPVVEAWIGLYSGKAALIPESGAFFEDLTFTTTSTVFAFNPTSFKVVGGDIRLPFIFAPKSSTTPGLHFVEFATTAGGYAPVVPLRVVVLATKCSISS